MTGLTWLALLLAGVVSAALTSRLRRHAMARQWLDVPNERSSHTQPTPRGGGLAIVLTFLTVGSALAAVGALDRAPWVALFGAGAAVAVVGWVDDRGHVPTRWRLLTHTLASAWALAWIGGMPQLAALGVVANLGWAGHALAVLGLVWLLNLYNFMDGIDGIAGVEALTVGLCAALIQAICLPSSGAWVAPALLAACAAGFLCLNFPPARIFMGDVGSGFIGLVLGILALYAGWLAAPLLWTWLILLGVFIVDATVTLLRRLLAGQRLDQAHRSHAYQQMARAWGSHRRVTLAVGAVNLLWLAPLALLVGLEWLDPFVGLIVAWAPLVALAMRWHAGDSTRDGG